MGKWRTLDDIRREYGELSLSESSAETSPFAQFKQWFEDVLQSEKMDPTAMVLSTVDEKGHPDSRIVLLKSLDNEAFVFFTNYRSVKAVQLNHHPYAALNFYWPQMARQVRIKGRVKKASKEQSDDYFSSRPLKSQYSAIASPQSKEIPDRALLEEKLNELIRQHEQGPVVRPDYWGGYCLLPDEFEFWQGRDNRLHDRIHYYKKGNVWQHRRLAP